ncbi:UNVERIFIED_CONTAM: hypothetical protein ABID98_001859 [Brevibacillus sp. OAP136]
MTLIGPSYKMSIMMTFSADQPNPSQLQRNLDLDVSFKLIIIRYILNLYRDYLSEIFILDFTPDRSPLPLGIV